MKTLSMTILSHAQSLPEGGMLSPKEFLHLGSRPAIDQAFSRLTMEGKLLRVGRGAYPFVSLASARQKARAEIEKRADGIDQKEARRSDEGNTAFGTAHLPLDWKTFDDEHCAD